MLRTVNVGRRSLSDYQSLVERDLMAEIRELAADIKGLRVCHISGSSTTGGIAELLASTVPLFNDAGLDTEWKALFGREEFFAAAGAFHAGLQGGDDVSDAEMQVFERYSLLNAGGMSGAYDVVVVHDPHPLGLRGTVASLDDAVWIWRCHLDLSDPNPATLERVRPMMAGYDLSVFHVAGYVPAGWGTETVIIPPAIDPLTPKNMGLAADDAAYIVSQFGVDPGRPLITQVSALGPWKDPIGVIDAFRIARQDVPGLQLALLGAAIPGERDYLMRTIDHAAADPDIHLLYEPNRVGPLEVNAFQTQADVVVQKSVREGFGLTVTEGLWKGRPVVAGDVGGISIQIADGSTGYLVHSPEQCAERVVQVIRDPAAAHEMARRGKQHVRHQFLTPRLVRDWLGLMRRLSIR